jgi:isoquinoline 1-oxidoreductase alpha subunit
MNIQLNVNGQNHSVTINNPAMPLLWVIRDLIGLTGTKYGCGQNICGCCTVLANNQPVRSCTTTAVSVAGQKIITVEGLSPDRSHPAQQAWIANQVPQCGYCQSGQLMAAAGAMLAGHHGAAIASQVKNVCICGTYPRIAKAVESL